MKIRTSAVLFVFGYALQLCAVEPQILMNWAFNDDGSKPWTQHANHCKNVRLEKGVLKGVTSGADPFLVSPAFSITAGAGQVVEFRAKNPVGGHGELFWIPVGAKGPQQKWSASFDWIGDGEWHDYRVRPFWQGEKRIGTLRIDFVNGRSDVAFEVASVRIVDESSAAHAGEPVWSGTALAAWSAVEGSHARIEKGGIAYRSPEKGEGVLESPALSFDSDAAFVLSVEMAVESGAAGTVAWACSGVSGLHKKAFRVKADGRFHTYNVDLGSEKSWTGKIVLLRLSPVSEKGGRALIR